MSLMLMFYISLLSIVLGNLYFSYEFYVKENEIIRKEWLNSSEGGVEVTCELSTSENYSLANKGVHHCFFHPLKDEKPSI